MTGIAGTFRCDVSGANSEIRFLTHNNIISMQLAACHSFGTGGTAYEGVGFTRAAVLTTVGNLGDSYNFTSVQIPFCDPEEYQQHDCTVEKSDLAYYYSLIDCAGTAIVLIGWLWLRSFEKKESENLDRATVTASDFTIRVPSIPQDTTEIELKGHFSKITADAVVDVNLAYDNSDEIELYLGRGKLMRERFMLVHKIRYHYTMARKFGEHMLDEDEVNSLKRQKSEVRRSESRSDADTFLRNAFATNFGFLSNVVTSLVAGHGPDRESGQ